MNPLRVDAVEYAAAGGRSRSALGGAEWLVVAIAAAVWTVALITADPDRGSGAGLPAWSSGVLDDFAGRARSVDEEGGGLLAGLVFGDVSGVAEGLTTAMRDSGLSHLTAVSGANCVIWAAAAGTLLRVRFIGWRWRILAQAAAVWAFAAAVGGPATVLRAATMLSVVYGVRLLGRGVHPAVSASWAVVLLIAAHPPIAHSLSFQLSVAATLGIVFLAGWMQTSLEHWLGPRLAGLLGVTLAAQLGCLPLLLVLGQAPRLSSVLANLLAAPAVPVATLSGIAAAALLWWPAAAELALWPGAIAGDWIAGLAHFFAAHPVGRIPWPQGSVGVLVSAVLVVALAAASQLPRGRPRRLVLRPLALAAFGVSVVTAGSEVHAVLSFPVSPIVVQCDVGQGDALVLRSGNTVAVIDVGPEPDAIDHCLDLADVDEIDLMVFSHYDADHVDGAEGVTRRGRRVDRMLVPSTADPRAGELATTLGAATMDAAQAGDRGEAGSMTWSALWPRQPPAGPVENADSLVVRIEFLGISVLALGDTDAESQRRFRAQVQPVDVLKVAHHGSADQDAGLMAAARPRIALISVGADNPYGHPRASLLELLDGIPYARTDLDGTVALSDPPTLSVWCAQSCHQASVE